MDVLSQILSSKTKAGIFQFLFGSTPEELHARELARRTGMTLATVQQELKRLESLDLVQRRKDGNRVYFKAKRAHPLYKDLHQLTIKTTGVVPMLRNALQHIAEHIDFAFVFGSIARSEEKSHSDIDLMIVGEPGLRQIAAYTGTLSEKLEREINPHAITLAEFQQRLEENDPFICNITRSEKLFIIGGENEFGAMAQKRLA